MLALVIGIASFVIACSFDWVSLKRIPGGKHIAACFKTLKVSEALR